MKVTVNDASEVKIIDNTPKQPVADPPAKEKGGK